MRVIAGSRRSLPLKTVEGLETRPTTDKVKETLFNILSPDLPDCEFLDLFAGSGAIGIEALSRGARHAVFVESGVKQQKCISENIAFTKFTNEADLVKGDAISYVRGLKRVDGAVTFDVIFMDPPYKHQFERDIILELDKKGIKDSAIIVVEADIEEDFSYIEETGFRIYKVKEYRNNKHVFICNENS